MTARLKLKGERFGRLEVLGEAMPRNGKSQWWVKCDCGSIFTCGASLLRTGKTQSCGCLAREVRVQNGKRKRTHGGTGTGEFIVWGGMKSRCFNPKATSYDRYGGRGITVCDRWKNDFASFLSDVGNRPSPRHELDRIDPDGNYEPGNVRWVLPDIQTHNRGQRSNVGIKGIRKDRNRYRWAVRRGTKLLQGYCKALDDAIMKLESAKKELYPDLRQGAL